MGTRNSPENRSESFIVRVSTALFAILIGSLSLLISASAGWHRGGNDDEKLLLAGVSVAAVLAVHLLLAISRYASTMVRVVGFVIWLVCATFTMYGLGSYFLGAQEEAREHQAAAIASSTPSSLPTPKRSLSVILAEQVKLRAALAGATVAVCTENCAALTTRKVILNARLQPLEAEAEEFRRWQTAQDQLDARRSALRTDPVALRLAGMLGATSGAVSLAAALLFSVILEGLGCLCWYLVLTPRDLSVTHPVTPMVMVEVTPDAKGHAHNDQPQSAQEQMLARVRVEIDAGRLNCTVKAIRNHLNCGQKTASAIRRMLSQGIPDAST